MFPLPAGAHLEALQRDVDNERLPGIRKEDFMHSATFFGTGRSVCGTAGGDLGRVPFGTLAEDLVCIFKGGIVPCLLRKDDRCYRLIGECFLNGSSMVRHWQSKN